MACLVAYINITMRKVALNFMHMDVQHTQRHGLDLAFQHLSYLMTLFSLWSWFPILPPIPVPSIVLPKCLLLFQSYPKSQLKASSGMW